MPYIHPLHLLTGFIHVGILPEVITNIVAGIRSTRILGRRTWSTSSTCNSRDMKMSYMRLRLLLSLNEDVYHTIRYVVSALEMRTETSRMMDIPR